MLASQTQSGVRSMASHSMATKTIAMTRDAGSEAVSEAYKSFTCSNSSKSFCSESDEGLINY